MSATAAATACVVRMLGTPRYATPRHLFNRGATVAARRISHTCAHIPYGCDVLEVMCFITCSRGEIVVCVPYSEL